MGGWKGAPGSGAWLTGHLEPRRGCLGEDGVRLPRGRWGARALPVTQLQPGHSRQSAHVFLGFCFAAHKGMLWQGDSVLYLKVKHVFFNSIQFVIYSI